MTGAPDRGFGAASDDDDDRDDGAVMRGFDASPVCLGRDVVAVLLGVGDTLEGALDGMTVGAEVDGPGVLAGADVLAGVATDEQPATVRTASATSADLDLTGQP